MTPLSAPIERIVHVVSGFAEHAFVAQTPIVEEATTSFAVSTGDFWELVSGSMRFQMRPVTDRSGGDRATLGRGTAHNHAAPTLAVTVHLPDPGRGCCPSEVSTSVRFGGRGGSASHEAITSAKAKSSRSGSASITARNSNLAVTSDLAVTMTGHTETGWRSSAVAEIT